MDDAGCLVSHLLTIVKRSQPLSKSQRRRRWWTTIKNKPIEEEEAKEWRGLKTNLHALYIPKSVPGCIHFVLNIRLHKYKH
jgi:hypothetical protein